VVYPDLLATAQDLYLRMDTDLTAAGVDVKGTSNFVASVSSAGDDGEGALPSR
jgi:hypothetical protein